MSFLRNKEIFKLFFWLGSLTMATTLLTFFCYRQATVWMLGVCLIFLCIFYIYTKNRYKKLAELAETIDKILHGKEFLLLEDNREGELAILRSEIHKMTIKLREHSYAMEKEKIYLTDSIADISHQLRTPLTTINLIIDNLQKEDLSRGAQQSKIREINALLARIEWLITSLLKISKIDAGTAGFRRSQVNVKELINKAVEPLLVPMEIREQEFEYIPQSEYVETGSEFFWGDFNWSVEAIGNIIKNSMEHTPEGGHITVSCSQNALYTEIIIKDTGGGIDPEDLPHLFQRFYRGRKAKDSGVGIGLALARMIIVEQNGVVKVENSRKDGGAVFTIRFFNKERQKN